MSGHPASERSSGLAHLDDFARAWTGTGRRGVRRPDSPLVHPGARTRGEFRDRKAPARVQHGTLDPDFHSNSK